MKNKNVFQFTRETQNHNLYGCLRARRLYYHSARPSMTSTATKIDIVRDSGGGARILEWRSETHRQPLRRMTSMLKIEAIPYR